MTRDAPHADELIRTVSNDLGISDEAVRLFVKRNRIDAVALYEEKQKVIARKAHGRMALGGRAGVIHEFVVGEEIEFIGEEEEVPT